MTKFVHFTSIYTAYDSETSQTIRTSSPIAINIDKITIVAPFSPHPDEENISGTTPNTTISLGDEIVDVLEPFVDVLVGIESLNNE